MYVGFMLCSSCSSVAVDVSHLRCGLSMRTVSSSKFSALWSHVKLPTSEHAGYGGRQSYWLDMFDYRGDHHACLAPRERPWHDFVGCRASGSNMPLVLFLPADKESESEFLTANCPMHPRTCCFLAFVLHGILIVYVLLLR